MKPEAKVEVLLWDWLITKISFIEKIYFNRKNKLNIPIFKVRGDSKRIPDMLIVMKNAFGIKVYSIEIKDNEKSSNVLKGNKILEYYKLYVEGKTRYYIDNKQIKIDGFLLATQSSKQGYLFQKEEIADCIGKKREEAAMKYKVIPRKEGIRTADFIRHLEIEHGKFRNDFDIKCGMGIIIANTEDNYKPWVQIVDYNSNKKRWGQQWQKL